MLPLFLLPPALATGTSTPSGCEASTLHHCVGWIGRALLSAPSRAWRDAVGAADSLPAADRILAPSELAEFYAAAAVAGIRLAESFAGGASRRPEDPSDAELQERTRAWARARCRIAPVAPLPVWVTEVERGALETYCEQAELLDVSTPRLVWIDGHSADAGTTARVTAGEHVLQHLDKGTVVTTIWQVSADAPAVPLPPLPVQSPERRRPPTLQAVGAITGVLLAGGGVAALLLSHDQQTELQELQGAYLRGEREDLDNDGYVAQQESLAAGVSGLRTAGITGVGVGIAVLGVTAIVPLFEARAEF